MLQGTPPRYGQRDPDQPEIDRTAQESGSQIKDTIEDATRRVREKVGEAAHEVRDTASTATRHVREQVAEAAEQVRGFDVQQQVREHPWMALGVAAIAGYVFGSVGGGARSGAMPHSNDAERYRTTERDHDDRRAEQRVSKEDLRNAQASYWSPSAADPARPATGVAQHEPYAEYAPHYSPATSFTQPQYGNQASGRERYPQRAPLWDNVRDQFGDELRTLMSAAVGAAMALVRDTVRENVPQFAEEYDRRSRERDPHEQATPSSDQASIPAGQATVERSRSIGASDARTSSAQHEQTFGTTSDVAQRSGFTDK